MVVNIRGPHGAGKSTAIRALMGTAFRPVYDVLFGLRHPEAYVGTLPGVAREVFILGRYDIPCGGCDTIQPYKLIPPLIEKYAARGHVLFEGVLVATCWGAVGEALERWGDAVILFLDTPVEECLRRVERRRGCARDERLIENVAAKHRAVERIRERVIADDILRAMTTTADQAPGIIGELLRQRNRDK